MIGILRIFIELLLTIRDSEAPKKVTKRKKRDETKEEAAMEAPVQTIRYVLLFYIFRITIILHLLFIK